MIVDSITDHNNTNNSNSNNGRQYEKDNKTNQLSVKPNNIEAVHNLDLRV
jgi:hypothetical protein